MASFSSFLYRQLFMSLPKPTGTQANKTVLVTGANVGLGKETARHFTQLGASTVILAVRSLEKGEAAKADIEKTTGKKNVVQVRHLDMSSYESVIDFAAKLAKEGQRLDIAILNAGVSRGHWEMMADDESTITVNVVSTFLLALSLLPQMKDTANKFNTRPTLSIVSSDVHYWAKFPEKDAPTGQILTKLSASKEGVDMLNRYQVSKLLDVLCTRAMADRKSAQTIPVTINTVNPGLCHSDLSREGGLSFRIIKALLARSTEIGARNFVYSGIAGPETHGHYISDCVITMPSDFVMSQEGYKAQNRVWEELCAKLEAIKPGVTGNL
jgi:NAD(P)-dependent dehydrogenase (short-subunit alcohol dehydrogenase family)